MNKIPYKVRLWLSIGLFIWAIVAFVVSVIYYANTMQMWIIIVIPIVAFTSFIMSIAFFPRFKDDGAATVEPKQEVQKQIHCKTNNTRKPFTSKKEWEELDEEDEECMYIDEGD